MNPSVKGTYWLPETVHLDPTWKSALELRIFLAVANRCRGLNHQCFSRVESLASDLSSSRQHVNEILHRLVVQGKLLQSPSLLEWKTAYGKGERLQRRWTINPNYYGEKYFTGYTNDYDEELVDPEDPNSLVKITVHIGSFEYVVYRKQDDKQFDPLRSVESLGVNIDSIDVLVRKNKMKNEKSESIVVTNKPATDTRTYIKATKRI
jgi:hypothetical protein